MLFYLFAFANQKKIEWSPNCISIITDESQAITGLDSFVEDLCKACGVSEYLILYSGDRNFRYKILPTYKHNRTDKEKPLLHSALKAYTIENHPTECWNGIEADDVLGIMSTMEPGRCVICSIDKDLKQIPGWHYNWNKMGKPQWITQEDGDFWFYYQILVGDTADGYKGCPGMGDKRTRKLLEDTPRADWWEVIVEAYEKKKLTEKDALQQARVARMLTVDLWNAKKKTPILWKPTMDKQLGEF